jgi:uncharacterized protein YneF (UPF0154 family)
MKILIALAVGLTVGFGAGYLTFYQVEKQMTLTLSDVDQMQPEQVREILTNKVCEKISHQTIQCRI